MIDTEIILKEKKISPSGEVAYLTFDVWKDFDFQEWQFVMIEKIINWETLKRAYSIASTKKELKKNKQISFYIKRASEKGMSDYLTKKIKEWDKFKIQGPFGKMINDQKENDYLFISIWCWLGPLLSIYRQVLESKNYNKISFVFWEKYKDDIVTDIKESFLSKNSQKIKNLLFLSREEKKDIPNDFRKGHIQDWIEEILDFLWTTEVKTFLCGKPKMVDSLKERLIENWLNKELIHSEKF